MPYVVATEAHTIPERPPVSLAPGDVVMAGRRDEDWPAFVFVTTARGSGWVPSRYLSADAGRAVVETPYDTTELATRSGEILEVVDRDDESGWLWCRSTEGREGWVPSRSVEATPDAPGAARIRPATSAVSDRRLLEEAVQLAATWRAPGPPAAIEETVANPDLSVYVEGWPRRGDFGVVAETAGVAIGAAWYRIFAADSHGYGFIDGSTPEVAVAVRPGHRGRGVGTRLMLAVIDNARLDGVAALSLSVEEDNPALALYRRLGFEIVGRSGNAWTMRLALV